jgi:hypothetical protein
VIECVFTLNLGLVAICRLALLFFPFDSLLLLHADNHDDQAFPSLAVRCIQYREIYLSVRRIINMEQSHAQLVE